MAGPSIQVIRPGETRKRFHRRPNFPIAGTMKPFGLYPIMAHLVLPGETLKSAITKWTVISMPLKNPIGGCWLESWLFYVKLTDIDRDLGEMFISDSFSTSGYTAGSTASKMFTKTGQIKWIEMCVNRIRDAYFINEGENPVTMAFPDLLIPMMKLNQRSWYQNIIFEPAEVAVDTTGAQDMTEQLRAWQMVQQMQMTEITYESYLEQYGVSSMKLGVGEPEILRYARSWTKPVNHVDPSTGTPSSAWVWNDEMKTEKDKRFQEPGFIVQMAGLRPKMFNSKQVYSMLGELWGFSDWYPAYNLTDPTAGIKRISSETDVMSDMNAAEGEVQMLYDSRDLLSHGEQFINDATDNPYPIPMAGGMSWLAADDPVDIRGEYPRISDIEGLFVDDTNESGQRAYYEGLTSLTIAGHVTDTTL